MSAAYLKQFDSPLAVKREVAGYMFYAKYGHTVPSLLGHSTRTGDCSVAFSDVRNDSAHTTISELLASGIYPTHFQNLLKSLAAVHGANITARQASGGTEMFYLRRLARLDEPKLQQIYENFCSDHPHVFVNDHRITLDPKLLTGVRQAIATMQTGVAVPSQGDFHERNIFSNGCMVDFEAAGWNLLATDIATFIWHTAFAGNYFAPKYADWSDGTLDKYYAQTPQICAGENTVQIALDSARKQMIRDYFENYLNTLSTNELLSVDACNAIAYRLLIMFQPQNMPAADRLKVFALANYFFAGTPALLSGKLKGLGIL
jgi:hypothetical protein